MIKKIINLSLIMLLFNSCGCIKMELTKEERSWCAYEKNEYLIFKSNLKNIDTLEVTDRNENYTNLNCNNIEVSFYQLNYIELNLALKSKTKSLLNCEISIMRDSDNENNHPSISIFGLKSDYPENGHKATKQNLKLNTTNKIYKETYLFKDNISATNIEDGYLDEFYYDQKNGLLKYVAKDGESFELIKRIKR